MEETIDVSILLGSGIYILLYKGRIQYVGQSLKPFRRIGEHWESRISGKARGNGTKGFPFDQVRFLSVPKQDLDKAEEKMILALEPKYNVQIGTHFDGRRVARRADLDLLTLLIARKVIPVLKTAPRIERRI